MTLEEFYSLCDSLPRTETDCMIWPMGVDRCGYPSFRIRGKSRRAGRLLLERRLGRPLSEDSFACHHCDNPNCVNVDHLYEGTPKSNVHDMMNRGRYKSVFLAGNDHYLVKNPERVARGIRHGSRTQPGSRASGDRNGSRTHPEKLPRGENHKNSKFTTEIILDIRSRNALGESQKSIARSYGVHQSAVSRIVLRKCWKHI